ncbi:MAG: hypothetical protein QXG00_04155 [Candidatus Woesearchaeota archaeon]
MSEKKKEKLLFVGTVNGESSLYSKKAKTYIRAYNANDAAMGLFKRYLKLFGRALVTDLFLVDGNKRTRVLFKLDFKKKQ